MAAGDVILITLNEVEQLFNTLDPSPFYERDLDEEAERFIIGSARELPAGHTLRLVITLPASQAASPGAQHIPEAIHNYFRYRAIQSRQELRELLRIGWRSLIIGFLVLASCLAGVRQINTMFADSTFKVFAEQSLVMLAWVANWRPLEIFLYDWWPITRRISLLDRLAAMTVDIRQGSGAAR